MSAAPAMPLPLSTTDVWLPRLWRGGAAGLSSLARAGACSDSAGVGRPAAACASALRLLRERHPERGDRDDHEQHELEHRERCRRSAVTRQLRPEEGWRILHGAR